MSTPAEASSAGTTKKRRGRPPGSRGQKKIRHQVKWEVEKQPSVHKTIKDWNPLKNSYHGLSQRLLRIRLTHEVHQFQKQYVTLYEDLHCTSSLPSTSIRVFPNEKRKRFQWPVQFQPKATCPQFTQGSSSTVRLPSTHLVEPICRIIEQACGAEERSSTTAANTQEGSKWTLMAKSLELGIEQMMHDLLVDGAHVLQNRLQVKRVDGWEQMDSGQRPCGNWKFIAERLVEDEEHNPLGLTDATKARIQQRLDQLFRKHTTT